MVYHWSGSPGIPPLPSLFSFQVYVTNGLSAATAGEAPSALFRTLQRAGGELIRCRLDVYFLGAGAGVEECVGHYRREKTKREGNRLCVLPSYVRSGQEYAGFLLMVEGLQWEEGGLGVVFFDAVEEEEEGDGAAEEEGEGGMGVEYHRGVPVAVQDGLDWAQRNPHITAVGAMCEELYRGSRFREAYEERYEEEIKQKQKE